VDVLPFGFSPYLFNPLNCFPKEDLVVFAGSWYEEESDRCQDLSDMFDAVIERGIPLVIYDRQTGTTKEGRKFPEKYQKYVHSAIPFEELGTVLKKSKYAINVNTIVDSETMFARRVLEFMAMNTMVISNESIGMKKLFQDTVWFAKENVYEGNTLEKCKKNLDYVFIMRTNKKLFEEAFHKVGVLEKQKPKKVAILSEGQKITSEYDYGFYWDGKSKIPDFEKLLPHFCYLPQNCGIKESAGNEFVIRKNADNKNTLFPKEMCRLLFEQPDVCTEKYYLGVSTK